MASSKISELLSCISKGVTAYQDHYSSEGVCFPGPHSHPSGELSQLPSDVESARQAAKEACSELQGLLSRPEEIIMDTGPASSRIMALDFIYTYKIGYDLDWGMKTTYGEIAKARSLDEQDTKRMLRLAMAHLLFAETDDGMVMHTAPSFELATNIGLSAWAGLLTQENWPPMLKNTEALSKYPGSEEPLESAYAMAHNLVEPAFKTWERDSQRIKRFSDGMQYIYSGVGFQPERVLQDLGFENSGNPVFVDVGGSKGHVSTALAQTHEHWKFIVQDSAQTIAVGEKELPEHLKNRVQFMRHDFFTEQPVKNASVYFFRMIFHDWSDKYALEIIRNLIPALKRGSRIIISDACLPPMGTISLYQEQWIRGYDTIMKCFNNGKERDAKDWASLFSRADAHFKFLGARVWPGSKEALIEAEWSPDVEATGVLKS